MKKNAPSFRPSPASKSPTGIQGLDDILRGGLPRGRNTLLLGGPGTGKTVLALQTLVNGARHFNEPGIFVAFEESSRQIIANAATFGWDLPALQKKNLFFLDAQMKPDVVRSGTFDISALLAILDAKVGAMGAKRVVFDAVDVLLALLDDPSAERQELFRLYHWLMESGLSGILTAKAVRTQTVAGGARPVGMEFMSDCVITLDHDLSNRVSLRNLWVMKYRGSGFSENAVPLSIGATGVELSASLRIEQRAPVTKRRVSSGVKRLDAMLGGGYFRGASVLITGAPGTSKSTLAAAFAEAACKRGERAVYISFDESKTELTRNFSSVSIDLQRHVDSGKLLLHCVLADGCSAKEHLVMIQGLLEVHRPSCLVIDPLTALLKSGGEQIALNIAERLMRLSKSLGITAVNTSLLTSSEQEESTAIQISTIADTWIHVSYVVNAGERNRALSIVKSRGTRHSNQVRELILTSDGVTLADTYTVGGEVLMGTMRWQREQAVVAEGERAAVELERKRRELRLLTAELETRQELLRREVDIKRTEMEALDRSTALRKRGELARSRALVTQRAGGKPEVSSE